MPSATVMPQVLSFGFRRASICGVNGLSRPISTLRSLLSCRPPTSVTASPDGSITATNTRVEVTLYKAWLPPANFDFGNGATTPRVQVIDGPFLGTEGITEIHGTSAFQNVNGACDSDICLVADPLNTIPWVDPSGTYLPEDMQAIVYSDCAKYIIQKGLDDNCLGPNAFFDVADEEWNLDRGVLLKTDVGGEITVSGKMTYGYNWDTKSVSAGWYRITFLLDPAC